MSRTHLLEKTLDLPLSRDMVFGFFADAFNLEAITPPFLRFRVTTPRPMIMRPGLIIDYRLRLYGIPVRWRSEITEYDPPFRFVDEQRRGPYSVWRHEHIFESTPATCDHPAGTRIIDRVTYAHPGGALVHRFFVRPSLHRIFAFREERLREVLLSPPHAAREHAAGMLRPC